MYRMRKKKSLTERMFALQVSRASEYRVNAHPYHVDFSGSCSTWVPRGCSQPPLAVGCRSVPALLCTPLGHAGAAPGQGAQQEISVPLTQLRTTTHLDQVGAVTAWVCSLFRRQSWRSPAWHLPPPAGTLSHTAASLPQHQLLHRLKNPNPSTFRRLAAQKASQNRTQSY